MKTNGKAEQYADEAEKIAFKVFKVIGFVILGIALVISLGFIIQLLWNWLVPSIFGLKEITYWQGMGLLVLAKILFGGISGSGSKSEPKKGERGPVSKAIHDEIHKEFKKEFYQKYKESCQEGWDENVETTDDLDGARAENLDQEVMYERWWKTEGEKQFETYVNREK